MLWKICQSKLWIWLLKIENRSRSYFLYKLRSRAEILIGKTMILWWSTERCVSHTSKYNPNKYNEINYLRKTNTADCFLLFTTVIFVCGLVLFYFFYFICMWVILQSALLESSLCIFVTVTVAIFALPISIIDDAIFYRHSILNPKPQYHIYYIFKFDPTPYIFEECQAEFSVWMRNW